MFGFSGAPAAEGRHAEPHTYRTHSFSHGHHDQRHIARGRVRTDDDVAQHGAHTGQPMHAAYTSAILIFEIDFIVN